MRHSIVIAKSGNEEWGVVRGGGGGEGRWWWRRAGEVLVVVESCFKDMRAKTVGFRPSLHIT